MLKFIVVSCGFPVYLCYNRTPLPLALVRRSPYVDQMIALGFLHPLPMLVVKATLPTLMIEDTLPVLEVRGPLPATKDITAPPSISPPMLTRSIAALDS